MGAAFSIIGLGVGLFCLVVGIACFVGVVVLGIMEPAVGLFYLVLSILAVFRLRGWVRRQKALAKAQRKASYITIPAAPRPAIDRRPSSLEDPPYGF